MKKMEEKKMSKTQCVYPQVDCLVAAEKIIGKNREWYPVNEEQKDFINKIFDKCRQEVGGMSELESIASWHTPEINNFLKEKGFDIELKEFQPGEFGTASVLDVLVKWECEGKHIKWVSAKNKEFDAAKMPNETVDYFTAEGHNYPIAKLLTQDNMYSVYMTMLDNEPEQLDLMNIAAKLQGSLEPNDDYESLIFPCVDLDEKVDISWLLKMQTSDDTGNSYEISQAVQQTKLRMNEKGARAESAAAVGISITSAIAPINKPDYIIDKPFLVWFDKPGLSQPLISGYMAEDVWDRPESLED